MLTEQQRQQWRSARDLLDAHLKMTLDRVLDSGTASGFHDEIIRVLIDTIPEIYRNHGNLTAELASHFYELARATAGLDDLFMPEPVYDGVDDLIAGSVRWALSPLDGTNWKNGTQADFDRARDRLFASATRLARVSEARTMAENMARDPGNPRFRRVPMQGACGFCMMLASRGFMYEKGTVLKTFTGARYHDRCKCTAEPQFPGETEPLFVKKIRRAWDAHAYPNGKGRDPVPEDFYEFVKNGGLGDRPIPGRDSKGRYRDTIDGKNVPFSRSDIEVHLKDSEKQRGLWFDHVMKSPSKRGGGGHAFEHAKALSEKIKRGGKFKKKKTFFPEGYSFERFNTHVRKTLGNPTYIREGNNGAFVFRREFPDMTIEVVVKPGGKNKPYSVGTVYPVAGQGFEVIESGDTIDLPRFTKRVI